MKEGRELQERKERGRVFGNFLCAHYEKLSFQKIGFAHSARCAHKGKWCSLGVLFCICNPVAIFVSFILPNVI